MNRAVLNTPDPATVPPPADTLAFHRALPGYEATPLVGAPDLAAELGPGRRVRQGRVEPVRPAGVQVPRRQLGDRAAARRLQRPRRAARGGCATGHPPADHRDGRQPRPAPWRGWRRCSGSTRRSTCRRSPRRRGAMRSPARAPTWSSSTTSTTPPSRRRSATPTPTQAARAVNDADLTGDSPVGEWVIQGYGTLFAEAAEALAAAGASVDLVVLQMGVGAFASSGIRWAISRGIPAVGAEPAGSACVATSARGGRPGDDRGSRTTMACLDAGTPTTAGWQTLIGGLSGVVVLDDPESDAAARRLAKLGIEAGESGAAGTAGLIALATQPARRAVARPDRLRRHPLGPGRQHRGRHGSGALPHRRSAGRLSRAVTLPRGSVRPTFWGQTPKRRFSGSDPGTSDATEGARIARPVTEVSARVTGARAPCHRGRARRDPSGQL